MAKVGAEVPLLEQGDLASDSATSQDVLIHAVEYFEELENVKYDWILLLQPTNPLVQPEDILGVVAKAIPDKNIYDTVISVVKMPNHLPASLFYEQEGRMEKVFGNFQGNTTSGF